MPQMNILKVVQNTGKLSMTTFLLLDEQQQLLALQLRDQTSSIPIQTAIRKETLPTEPQTLDFFASVLHALGGTLEEIAVAISPDKQLYAQLHLRDQHNLHVLNASLDDALRLAHREKSRISVSEEILAQRAVNLADYGATEAEQLAEVFRRAERNPDSLRRTSQAPLNLDFSDGLQGWNFLRDSTYGSYELDSQATLTGKACLAITLHKPFTHGSSGILLYGGSLPEHYRGQRIRLSAYVKTEQMYQPELEFHLSWPTDKISPWTGTVATAECMTRSRIVAQAEEGAWVRHEMVINVPTQARHFRFQLGTKEQGKLWLDGIELATVDQSVALTGTILRPPPTQPVNLDFSEGLEYWEIEGNTPGHYDLAVDTTNPSCASLKSVVKAPIGSCVLLQKLSMENYQGKAVRLSAFLKSLDVTSRATLFISLFRVSGEKRVEQAITGTTPWTPASLDWRVPAEPVGFIAGFITFGVSLQGPGQVWLKDIHLQIVEEA